MERAATALHSAIAAQRGRSPLKSNSQTMEDFERRTNYAASSSERTPLPQPLCRGHRSRSTPNTLPRTSTPERWPEPTTQPKHQPFSTTPKQWSEPAASCHNWPAGWSTHAQPTPQYASWFLVPANGYYYKHGGYYYHQYANTSGASNGSVNQDGGGSGTIEGASKNRNTAKKQRKERKAIEKGEVPRSVRRFNEFGPAWS